jgi:predicted transcriptional regulator
MGSSQSSSVKQTVEVLNKSMTNLVTKNTNSASAKNTNSNSFKITIGEKGDVQDCNISLTQKINAKQAVKVMAKFASEADLKTQMKSALKNSVDQSSASTQAALATSIGVQNSKQEINQKISNIVETNITNETFNEVNGFLDNLNKGELEIKGKWSCAKTGGAIVINQDIVSEQIVELLSDTMVGNKITTSTDNATVADSKQVLKSEQKGAIDAIFGGISGLFTGPIMAIGAIIILIAIIGIIGKMMMSKKETAAAMAFLFGRKRVRGRR